MSSFQKGDEDGDLPFILLSKDEASRLYQPWNKSLIVRMVGKNVKCSFMIPRLKSLWKITNQVSGFDLGECYILVKFFDETNLGRVMNGGPHLSQSVDGNWGLNLRRPAYLRQRFGLLS